MARTGMADIIAEIRQLCDLSENDYTVNSVSYWTDDQIQGMADRYRNPIRGLLLKPVPQYLSGIYQYTDYIIPIGLSLRIEGDSAFRLYDINGNDINSGFTVSYTQKVVTFSSDTSGSPYYVDINVYDIYAIVAEIWEQKATHYAGMSDWSSDNHNVKASQLFDHAIKRAVHFRSLMGFKVARLVRNDTFE